MPLSSVMICLDNSEWMRNGDYTPDRLEAQHDSANLIIRRRLQMNPENTVGVLHMAGRGVELKVTPSRDNQKLLSSTSNMRANGKIKLTHSVKIAMLALKHRQNKRGAKRIVVFVGSPIEEKEKDMKKLGKALRRDNVALDIILLGCDKANKAFEGNENLAKTLVESTIKDSNSYLTVVAPGVLPSQLISSSHLCVDGAGPPGSAPVASAGGASGDDAFAEYGGFDPSVDPEMAMVMRMSLMEARQNASGGDSGGAATSSKAEELVDDDSKDDTTSTASVPVVASSSSDGHMDDDALMRQAVALSMPGAADDDEEDEDEDDEDDDDDEALLAALRMSQGLTATAAPTKSDDSPAIPAATSGTIAGIAPATMSFNDPAFVASMLSRLPGVNPDDPRIRAAMEQISGGSGDKKSGTDDKKGGDKGSDK
eukprot:g1046.t1